MGRRLTLSSRESLVSVPAIAAHYEQIWKMEQERHQASNTSLAFINTAGMQSKASIIPSMHKAEESHRVELTSNDESKELQMPIPQERNIASP